MYGFVINCDNLFVGFWGIIFCGIMDVGVMIVSEVSGISMMLFDIVDVV